MTQRYSRLEDLIDRRPLLSLIPVGISAVICLISYYYIPSREVFWFAMAIATVAFVFMLNFTRPCDRTELLIHLMVFAAILGFFEGWLSCLVWIVNSK